MRNWEYSKNFLSREVTELTVMFMKLILRWLLLYYIMDYDAVSIRRWQTNPGCVHVFMLYMANLWPQQMCRWTQEFSKVLVADWNNSYQLLPEKKWRMTGYKPWGSSLSASSCSVCSVSLMKTWSNVLVSHHNLIVWSKFSEFHSSDYVLLYIRKSFHGIKELVNREPFYIEQENICLYKKTILFKGKAENKTSWKLILITSKRRSSQGHIWLNKVCLICLNYAFIFCLQLPAPKSTFYSVTLHHFSPLISNENKVRLWMNRPLRPQTLCIWATLSFALIYT